MSAPPPAVVLDIDGVLADTRHRMHHLDRSPPDWDAFFAVAGDDPPHPEGLAVAAEAAARSRLLVYLSGRPERWRGPTQDWLDRHGLPSGQLVLRPEGDRRPAATVKVAALRRLAAGLSLQVLVDDDPEVVAAVERRRGPGGRPLVGQVLLATWQPRAANG